MTNPKPATVGEREVCKFTGLSLASVRQNNVTSKLARRFDAVVKRAFKDGIAANALYLCSHPDAADGRRKLLAKYGVKARGK